jgi:hypothetical protein
MSEKTRQKKDGEDKGKNEQRMHEVNKDADKKNASSRSQRRTASGGSKK